MKFFVIFSSLFKMLQRMGSLSLFFLSYRSFARFRKLDPKHVSTLVHEPWLCTGGVEGTVVQQEMSTSTNTDVSSIDE